MNAGANIRGSLQIFSNFWLIPSQQKTKVYFSLAYINFVYNRQTSANALQPSFRITVHHGSYHSRRSLTGTSLPSPGAGKISCLPLKRSYKAGQPPEVITGLPMQLLKIMSVQVLCVSCHASYQTMLCDCRPAANALIFCMTESRSFNHSGLRRS